MIYNSLAFCNALGLFIQLLQIVFYLNLVRFLLFVEPLAFELMLLLLALEALGPLTDLTQLGICLAAAYSLRVQLLSVTLTTFQSTLKAHLAEDILHEPLSLLGQMLT